MNLGIILLIFVAVIIFFGAAQRVLDRLYISDTMALFIIAAIIGGSFFNLPLYKNPDISINIGGAIIPLLLVIYVLARADNSREVIRTIVATVITAAAIYAVTLIFRNFGEGRDLIDPMYMFAITAGIVGYLFGRSRRGAFVAGTMGFLIYNLINVWRVLTGRVYSQVIIGGAGVFDSIIISGFFALLLAEVVGETRESILHKEGGEESNE